MNQKQNSITFDLNIHFESSLELRNVRKWIIPIAIGVIRLAIHLYGGS